MIVVCGSLLEALDFPVFLVRSWREGCPKEPYLLYEFEAYCLDADRRELRREAEVIAVEPRVFDLLQYLIRNRDRVVTKDELIASVWGGRIVSDSALTSRMNAARHAIGDSGEAQRLIRTVSRKGHRFVAEVQERDQSVQKSVAKLPSPKEDKSIFVDEGDAPAISFCQTKDGVSLAIATVGAGPVLLRAANWFNNIEEEWRNPLTAPLFRRLSRRFRLIRYDGRGSGLSDRNVTNMSFETYQNDLETVIDSLQLKSFALFGISGGAASAAAYAARHPERVSKLILCGGYPLGRNKRRSPQSAKEAEAFITMLRSGWCDDQSLFWRAFCSFFLPNGSPDQIKSWTTFQRAAFAVENAAMGRMAVDNIDILNLLPLVTCPTIIFHSRGDRLVPFEQGRLFAASIPHAKFIPMDSENHLLLSEEPAWVQFVAGVEAFLTTDD